MAASFALSLHERRAIGRNMRHVRLEGGQPNPQYEAWIKRKQQVFVPSPSERKQLVSAIAQLPELEVLQLSFELDEDDIRTLACLRNLQLLTFETSQLTDATVVWLLTMRHLQRLGIHLTSRERLPLAMLAKLRCNRALLDFDLIGTFPREDGDAKYLQAALPHVEVEIVPPVASREVRVERNPRSGEMSADSDHRE